MLHNSSRFGTSIVEKQICRGLSWDACHTWPCSHTVLYRATAPLHTHVTGIFRESVLWCQQSLTRLNIPNTQPATHWATYVNSWAIERLKWVGMSFFMSKCLPFMDSIPTRPKSYIIIIFLRPWPKKYN